MGGVGARDRVARVNPTDPDAEREVDLLSGPALDLVPSLSRDPNIVAKHLDEQGWVGYIRPTTCTRRSTTFGPGARSPISSSSRIT